MPRARRAAGGPPPEGPLQLRPWAKVCAAAVGSVVTAALLTPVDALRIRLQVARALDHAPQADCPFVVRTCDGFGGFLDAHGADMRPCDCRTAGHLLESRSAVQAMRVLIREEGWRTLYTALPITFVVTVPSVIIYYAGYEELRLRLLKRRLTPDQATMLSAATVRLISTSLVSPLEMVRTQTQALGRHQRTWTWYAGLSRVCRQHGVASLWRGLAPTLWRDVPFSVLYWSTYERTKAALVAPQDPPVPLAASFFSGACAGTLASLLTHPFDVAKTRIQTSFVRHSHLRPPADTTWGVLRHIYQAEGAAGWMAGWQPRVGRVAPACAIMITTYEAAKWALQRLTAPS
jgi:solute carrier family 25 protein 39/40